MYSCATSAPATLPALLMDVLAVATMSQRSSRPPTALSPVAYPDLRLPDSTETLDEYLQVVKLSP
jgi:hypothetical protein